MNLKAENKTLKQICKDLQWMARRYADGRSTYAVGLVNDCTKTLLVLGVDLFEGDGALWARDGMDILPGVDSK